MSELADRRGLNKRYESDTEANADATEALERLRAHFDIRNVTRPVAGAAADGIDWDTV